MSFLKEIQDITKESLSPIAMQGIILDLDGKIRESAHNGDYSLSINKDDYTPKQLIYIQQYYALLGFDIVHDMFHNITINWYSE